MGRTKDVDGQQDLIEVDPASAKELLKVGRAYRRLREANGAQRAKFREQEAKQVLKFMEALKEADIKPLANGSYRFQCDGYIITIPAVKNPPIRMKALGDTEEEEDGEE